MAENITWDDGTTDWDQPGATWDSTTTPVIVPNPNTVYIPFAPTGAANFQFQVTLDGAEYVVVVNWNLFGQRYYINIYDTAQTLIVCLPLIGSPLSFNISMTAGYFTTSLIYRTSSGNFEVF
ncbi:MAG: hypothetical protein V4447_10640 [Pseudomonadota bacterium]